MFIAKGTLHIIDSEIERDFEVPISEVSDEVTLLLFSEGELTDEERNLIDKTFDPHVEAALKHLHKEFENSSFWHEYRVFPNFN